MNRIEIDYEVNSLAEMTKLVQSPNLDISIGLTVTVILGPNVLSVENHNLVGKIVLDWGAVSVNGEWVGNGELGNQDILCPLKIFECVKMAVIS